MGPTVAGVTETTLQKYLHELCVAVVKVPLPFPRSSYHSIPSAVPLCAHGKARALSRLGTVLLYNYGDQVGRTPRTCSLPSEPAVAILTACMHISLLSAPTCICRSHSPSQSTANPRSGVVSTCAASAAQGDLEPKRAVAGVRCAGAAVLEGRHSDLADVLWFRWLALDGPGRGGAARPAGRVHQGAHAGAFGAQLPGSLHPERDIYPKQ